MNSKDITVTQGRLLKAFSNIQRITSDNKINEKIKTEVDKSKIQLGEMTKFYPYLDKAEVKLKNQNKTVICKILHRCWGDILDFFTPAGERVFCDNLKEPCIVPIAPIPSLIVDINDNTHEWLLLGYYSDSDIVFNKPAERGCYKLSNICAVDEYYLQFGNGKFEVEKENGGSSEYYTKKEVDELLEKLKGELQK